MVIQVQSTSNTSLSRSVFVADSKGGDIWKHAEWRKIITGYTRKGTLLKIYDATAAKKKNVDDPTTISSKAVSFSCVAFGPEQLVYQQQEAATILLSGKKEKPKYSYNYPIVAGDQRGHIYCFDLVKNKFWLVARSGVATTCIAFNNVRKREIVVGLADNSLHCYQIDSCQLVAKLPSFHHYEPHHICMHPSKPLAISTCKSEALLWNTEEWVRKRLLTGNQCGVQQSSFSPDGMSIVTAFSDGSIFVWFLDTFTLQWKLTLEQLTGPQPSAIKTMNDDLLSVSRSSYFAMSEDGEILIYSGLSSTLYVWDISEKRLLHEILIPSFKGQIIVQVEFLGSSKTAALLSDHGILIFVDVVAAKFVGQMQGKHTFHKFAVTPDGYTLTTILKSAKFIMSLLGLDVVMGIHALETDVDAADFELEAPVEGKDELAAQQKPCKVPPRITVAVQQPKTFFELVESKQDTKIMNRQKLRGFLNYYGAYPEKHRVMIWRFLLKLPENREGYESLLLQGLHPEMKQFKKKFPLKSDKLSKMMEKILSCLAHWSPIFENLDYLPAVIFPFVKLFGNDLFSGLEVVMTVLINWCQKWWDYYPNPPVECLDVLEDLLGFHDPELLSHFVKYKVTSQLYGWMPMHTLFSELFSLNEWLRVWDHLVSNQPAFMYYLIIAYVRYYRSPLLEIDKLDDFRYHFQKRNSVNVSKLLIMAYDLQGNTPISVSPSSFLEPFKPLLRGQYPIFNRFPEFIVNYQSKMKERIRKDEEDYLYKRKVAEEMNRLTDELSKDKKSWETADWKMNDMIDTWWDKMAEEDKYQNDRKTRFELLEKDSRAKVMSEISQARQAFLHHQNASGEQHISNLSRTIQQNRNQYEKDSERNHREERFESLESEWAQRRQEMIQAREELKNRETDRTGKLVQHALDIGLETVPVDDLLKKQMAEKDVYGGDSFISPSPALGKESISPTKVVTFATD